MFIPRFRNKYPSSTLTLIFNFGPALPPNVLLNSVSIDEISSINGLDPLASTIAPNPPVIPAYPVTLSNGIYLPQGTFAELVVTGGKDGMEYLIAIAGTTYITNFTPVCKGILPVTNFG